MHVVRLCFAFFLIMPLPRSYKISAVEKRCRKWSVSWIVPFLCGEMQHLATDPLNHGCKHIDWVLIYLSATVAGCMYDSAQCASMTYPARTTLLYFVTPFFQLLLV